MGRPRKPAHLIKHGTEQGYQYEMSSRYVEVCEGCRRAHAAHTKKRRAKRRKQRAVINEIMRVGQVDVPPLPQAERERILRTIKEDLDGV